MENFFSIKDGRTVIALRVSTKASKNAIVGVRNGALLVSVTSVPENGKANAAIIKLLSDKLRIAKSKIEIGIGHKSKNKVVTIHEEIPDLASQLSSLC